ncbi:protein cereblon [Adelges cooleyi]|uniref:protein cereblon n=1 Tax=Adelges cooleyi TaxID=133065 RepID=UPI00217FB77E|nr:protein cereblon [Adelges cooleyi]
MSDSESRHSNTISDSDEYNDDSEHSERRVRRADAIELDRAIEEYVNHSHVSQYDQSLTPAHKYLGNQLRETSGRAVYEEGVVHVLPVIFLGINVVPGQILPMIARSTAMSKILKYAIARNRAFGVSYKLNKNKRTYGTIVEVFEHTDGIENLPRFHAKAMGHQRYEILSVKPFPESLEETIVLAQIRVLKDSTLLDPYSTLCLHPRRRTSKHDEVCRKKDMGQTQWPEWVYKQFDVNHLADRLTDKIRMAYKDVKISDDPDLLSFQAVRLGVFNQEQVSDLLGINSTNMRLQYELNYWNKNQSMQKFMCARKECSIPVCNMSSVFPMSPEGPQGTYCNSWGQIHDMITVTELDEDLDVTSVGRPSEECCWFPGYSWLIILCPNCQNHLGWRYLANNNKLMPRIFYGLCTRSITSTRNYLRDERPDFSDDLIIDY